MKDVEIIGMLKTFVNETLVGMGALKGAPCTVQGVADQGDGTQVLTLKWTDTDGVSHTTDISLPSAVFEFTNPTNGQTIRYNSTSGKWENSNVSFSADLGDLDDVIITSVQDGQVLTYDAANNRWINADGSTVAAMSDLTDVTITTVQNGQILTYDSTSQKWVNVTLDIDDLGNVSISSASDGQILTYNATSGKWENKTLELDAGDIGYDNTTSGLSATDTQAAVDELADEKVDKEIGKGLSTNDYTNESKAIVDGVTDELAKKVDKETGKGLSTNDFTTALKDKLDGIETGAEVNVLEAIKLNGTALSIADKTVNLQPVLGDLNNVDLTNLADGMILIYDANTQKFVVAAQSGGTYTAGPGIEIDQNNKISSKIVLFTGTEAQWNALPLDDKIKFTHYATNDDQTGQIDSVPTQGSANLMTSGGIYTALQNKADVSDITDAIEALDVTDAAVAGSYVTEVSEADGKIAVVREAADAVPTESSNKMVTSGGVYAANEALTNQTNDIVNVLGAKNFVPYPYQQVNSSNGITWTDNGDGTITADGTATGNSWVKFAGSTANPVEIPKSIKELVGKEVIMSSGEYQSGIGIRIDFYDAQLTELYHVDTSTIAERKFTIPSDSVYMAFQAFVTNGVTASNVTIYPMIRLASDPDNTYVPYAKTNRELTVDKAELTQISNPNLLDNPWFTVNQRALSSYPHTSSTRYTTDRWFENAHASITVSSSGITITSDETGSNSDLGQNTDGLYDLVVGKMVTASVMTSNGKIYHGSGIIPSSRIVGAIIFDLENGYKCDINVNPESTQCALQFFMYSGTNNPNASISVRACKLELGSVSTLAMDTAPNYATELLKCQRYFVRYTGAGYPEICHAIESSSVTAWGLCFLPVPMRTKPSVAFANVNAYRLSDDSATAITAMEIHALANNACKIMFTLASNGQNGAVVEIQPNSNSNGYVDFSADL